MDGRAGRVLDERRQLGGGDNPPVADASLPPPWSVLRSGNVFKIAYPHGTVLMFR